MGLLAAIAAIPTPLLAKTGDAETIVAPAPRSDQPAELAMAYDVSWCKQCHTQHLHLYPCAVIFAGPHRRSDGPIDESRIRSAAFVCPNTGWRIVIDKGDLIRSRIDGSYWGHP